MNASQTFLQQGTNTRYSSRKLVLIFLFLLIHAGCVQLTDLKTFERGEHALIWYKFEGGDVSSFDGWGVVYKSDCGLFMGNRPIYLLEPASFIYYDSLSVEFLSADTVVIVPFKDGVPIERLSCIVNLADIDCETNGICKFRFGN